MTGLSNSRREGPRRSAWNFGAIAVRPRAGVGLSIRRADNSASSVRRIEIPARAKNNRPPAQLVVEHRDRAPNSNFFSASKFKNAAVSDIRTHGVSMRYAIRGAIVVTSHTRSVFFNSDCHIGLLFMMRAKGRKRASGEVGYLSGAVLKGSFNLEYNPTWERWSGDRE